MISQLLEEISRLPGCRLLPLTGECPRYLLEVAPPDLAFFFERHGGAELFTDQPFGFRILGATGAIPSNRAVFGESYYLENRQELDADLTSSWHLIAIGSGPEEKISIDLGEDHKGRCYDSFREVHGGSDCAILSMSFTELLRRLLDAKGEALFWNESDAPCYGFAR